MTPTPRPKDPLVSRLHRFYPCYALLSFVVAAFAMPAGEMPANTIPLSGMMQQLSSQPGFTEAFLAQVEGTDPHKAGAAYLTPELVQELRKLILGKDWQGLNRFPGWTMARINPTVRVVGHFAGKDAKVDSAATTGGAPRTGTSESRKALTTYLDTGPYGLGESQTTIDLSKPSTLPGFDEASLVSTLGDGVTRGDGPSPIASEHAASQRLADTLNRLSINGAEGVGLATALWSEGQQSATPQRLIAQIAQSGSTVTVTDSRYFANFGHLHYNGRDVMMPFWVNSQLVVPTAAGTPERPLLVPVSHAEYEWHIRGPLLNADVSFYFGIDGKAEFRTMDQLDQAWVMKRDAHTYTGADAVEVTRLSGLMIQTYAHLHEAHPTIPFGGYYAFGVCQDVVAAIELKMTGKTTLFPNTADARFFSNPQDAEINDLIQRIPKDRDGKPPSPERIFGSLPVGSTDAELRTVTIPGLAPDLIAVHDAWQNGTVEHVGERRFMRNVLYVVGALLMLAMVWMIRRHRRRQGE
jgi:hypothetical protein